MNANTSKNREYDQKQASKIRPTQPVYNFVELDIAVRQWIKPVEEIYSPYLGAV